MAKNPIYDFPGGVIMTPPLGRKYGVLPLGLARVKDSRIQSVYFKSNNSCVQQIICDATMVC